MFGYDSRKLETLKALGYKVGASLPGTVSLDGRRYDYHVLYKELRGRYRFKVERSYANAGLYPTREVLKVKNPDLKIRGYRKEDRPILDSFVSTEMVIRGIASGVFGWVVSVGPRHVRPDGGEWTVDPYCLRGRDERGACGDPRPVAFAVTSDAARFRAGNVCQA